MKTGRTSRSVVEQIPFSTAAAVLLELRRSGSEFLSASQIRSRLEQWNFSYSSVYYGVANLESEGLVERRRGRRSAWRATAAGQEAASRLHAMILVFLSVGCDDSNAAGSGDAAQTSVTEEVS